MVAGHSFPDYDTTFALIWGHDLAHGHGPDYGLPLRPGGHPLTTVVATALSVLGRSGAAEALRWLVLLGAGALVAGVFRLGQALFGTAVGVLAALLLFTRTPLWGFSLLGYMDVPATALIVWAAVLEVRKPRRGASVLLLLALAGLVRPEPWLMAGAYWIWLGWGGSWARALRLAPLVLAAPALWIAFDAATTQTLLGSVRTKTGAPVGPSTGGHGLHDAPRSLARFLGGFVRPPEGIAAALGAGIGLARVRERPLVLVPLGVLAINVLGFLLIARSGGPLEQRYVFPAAAMLIVLAAYGALGWLDDPSRRLRPAWRAAGALCAVAFVAYLPVDVDRLRDLRTRVVAADESYSALRDVVRRPAARCALAGRVWVPNARLRPFVAYWGELPLERVSYTDPPSTGAIQTTSSLAAELSSRSLPSHPPAATTSAQPSPRGFGVVARGGGWQVAAPCARQ